MIRVAFIGAGRMAHHHLAALKQSRVSATVVGVYDRASDQAQAFAAAAGCPAFTTTGALFAQAAPEIVHVCTPPDAHFESASAALEGGAHVYVEKPFAPTFREAYVLLDLARARGRLVCAGHQLLRDPAFEQLIAKADGLGPLIQVDSHFTFRPVGVSVGRSAAVTLAQHLVDILPHPLYSLVSVLERCSTSTVPLSLAWLYAVPDGVQAILRAGDVTGRLSVSLRARPIASSLTLTGTRGSLTCDFVRSILVGSGNPGTEALEKVLNQIAEGTGLAARAAWSTARRLASGTSYAGLPQLFEAFYGAVASGGPSPVSPDHLLQVTRIFEAIVAAVDTAVIRRTAPRPIADRSDAPSRIVVSGARGFLGAEIARALAPVCGIGRGGSPGTPHLDRWITADLSQGLDPALLAGADIVVHAAAEVSGGYAEHTRNSIDATRHLLHAMHKAGVRRLVHVSSLSVIRPPRGRERQDESTPRPEDAKPFGPYTWGKCAQEALILSEAGTLGIETRIIRPGALLDRRDPDVPGLMGRRLFGQWHLGLGRPGLPIAVCDVEQCADVIAWCVRHFDDAPPIVNLLDPSIASRGDLQARLRGHGWTGRVVWIPISVLAVGITAARTALAFAHGRRPDALKTWSILRPRRYDARVATALLDAVRLGSDSLSRVVAPAPASASDHRRPVSIVPAGARAGDKP
jgi:predicted dehydrogenase/nucleoside-diphosphate-sugar epimerase